MRGAEDKPVPGTGKLHLELSLLHAKGKKPGMVHNAMLHYGSASERLDALTEALKTRCSQRSQPLEFPDDAMSPSKPSMEAGRKITVGATVRDGGRFFGWDEECSATERGGGTMSFNVPDAAELWTFLLG